MGGDGGGGGGGEEKSHTLHSEQTGRRGKNSVSTNAQIRTYRIENDSMVCTDTTATNCMQENSGKTTRGAGSLHFLKSKEFITETRSLTSSASPCARE